MIFFRQTPQFAPYVADIRRYAEATNNLVPLVFPQLRRKFGDTITSAESPARHPQMEFAFDVVQLAAGRFSSASYQRTAGFAVSQLVLRRAFRKTYGLELDQILPHQKLNFGLFRLSVQQLIPLAARAA